MTAQEMLHKCPSRECKKCEAVEMAVPKMSRPRRVHGALMSPQGEAAVPDAKGSFTSIPG